MRHVSSEALRVIALGGFKQPIPPLAPRLAALNVVPLRKAGLADLPARLDSSDIVLTDLSWLLTLDAAETAALQARMERAAAWIALSEPGGRFKDLVEWQRLGVTHFFKKPLDPERLAALAEDVHDRIGGAAVRAMLVDDEESALAYYSEALKRRGVEVLATSDPLLVVDAIDDFKPDVLILDIEMPGCRGQELATILRQAPAHARLPVIFLTAMEGIDDRLLARAAAGDDYLNKPVSLDLLHAAVETQAVRYRAHRRNEDNHRRVEAQARLRLEQMRMAIDEHAEVSITDADGVITYVNQRFCRAHGYSAEELIGHTHAVVNSGVHPDEFFATLWRTIGGGKAWHGELCNRARDGGLHWFDATVVPFVNSRGLPQQYISIRTDITLAKQRHLALQETETRFRSLFDNLPAGALVHDPDGRVIAMNDAAGRILGMGRDQVIGRTMLEGAWTPIREDGTPMPEAERPICVTLTTGRPALDRVVGLQFADRVVWVSVNAAPLFKSGEAQPYGIIATFVDITARKASLAALRRAQAQAHIGDWQYEIGGGEMRWSEEIYRIFGREPRDFVPTLEALVAAVHPDDRPRVAAAQREAIEQGQCDLVYRIQRPDGSVRFVRKLARRVLDAAGQPVRLVGTVQDITERHVAELRLRDSEERFHFAVEGAGDGIWDWDLRTGAMLLSAQYEIMLGYQPGELEATVDAWRRSVHPDDLDHVGKVLNDYLTGARPAYAVELRLRCKSGAYRWVLCRGTVVARDAGGQPIRMIGIHSDISARKAAEAELIQAREVAERASLAKSSFLSSMSHELRTPMNAIIGFAQMLEYDEKLDADQKDNAQEILKAGRHLLDLINEVLDLAKIESGRISLSIEGVSLCGVVEECLGLVQPLLEKSGLRLAATPCGRLAVHADRVRFKQTVLNLLSNAIKYNRPGGEVGIAAEQRPDGYVRLSISDTGAGIAADHLEELFEPFARGEAENSGIEGTGIGLALTRQLVELMGGRIGVDSQVGFGSTFWLEFPAAEQAADGATQEAGPLAERDVAARRARVLCIDDNPVNIKLIAQILGKRPAIDVITAHAPELGIELAKARPPDLILLDINMPGMDGYAVLEVFKADPDLSRVPVVAITANAMPRDIERGRAAGFRDYLTKPLAIAGFLDTVDTVLAERPGAP